MFIEKMYKYTCADGTQRDICLFYKSGTDIEEQQKEKRPAFLFYFGGGWRGGSISSTQVSCGYFASRDFVGIAPQYRVLSTDNVTPDECVKDAKLALKWVYDNADELGIDKNRIVVAGSSAGAHLAACTSVFPKISQDDIDVSYIPKAHVLINPVLDCSKQGFCPSRLNEEEMLKISPFHHMHDKIPPTVIFHGTADEVVPYRGSAIFCQKLTELGVPCALHSYTDGIHGFYLFNRSLKTFADVMTKAEEFLKTHEI